MGKKNDRGVKVPKGWSVGTNALIWTESGLLMGQLNGKKAGRCKLPGGAPKKSDHCLERTVIREVLEETGLDVKVVKRVTVYRDKRRRKVVFVFLCTPVGGRLGQLPKRCRQCPEMRGYVHIRGLDEIDNWQFAPRHRKRVKDAYRWRERAQQSFAATA